MSGVRPNQSHHELSRPFRAQRRAATCFYFVVDVWFCVITIFLFSPSLFHRSRQTHKRETTQNLWNSTSVKIPLTQHRHIKSRSIRVFISHFRSSNHADELRLRDSCVYVFFSCSYYFYYSHRLKPPQCQFVILCVVRLLWYIANKHTHTYTSRARVSTVFCWLLSASDSYALDMCRFVHQTKSFIYPLARITSNSIASSIVYYLLFFFACLYVFT